MTPNTFIQGISRVLNCPKVHVAATGLVTTYFAIRFVTGDLPPTQRASLWVAFIGAVAVQLREIINAWTEEDVAAVASAERKVLSAEPPLGESGLSFSSQNSASTQASAERKVLSAEPPLGESGLSLSTQNSALSTTPTLGTQNSAPSTTPALGTQDTLTVDPPTFLERTQDMPARTKLPSIMIAFTSIALLAATGCQTSPELTTYREGLHQVDEPLYQAHLLLMDDAVKANIRTPSDQQVVQQGIAAAEALYQQSKATAATSVAATTQP